MLAQPAWGADAPAEATITLASTTSVDNSGLLGAILPEFTKATGITVHVLALGTGQGAPTRRAARRPPTLFSSTTDRGRAAIHRRRQRGSTRQQIALNDFIIVGPGDDPACISLGGPGDAKGGALITIADVHAAFVSRGDQSGTNALELRVVEGGRDRPGERRRKLVPRWYRRRHGARRSTRPRLMPAYTLSGSRHPGLPSRTRVSSGSWSRATEALINRFYDVIEHRNQQQRTRRQISAGTLAGRCGSGRRRGQEAIGAYRVGRRGAVSPVVGKAEIARPNSTGGEGLFRPAPPRSS